MNPQSQQPKVKCLVLHKDGKCPGYPHPVQPKEKWVEGIEQFKKKYVIESEPEDYIHVGLDSSHQFSTLKSFIKTAVDQARQEGRNEAIKKLTIVANLGKENGKGLVSMPLIETIINELKAL